MAIQHGRSNEIDMIRWIGNGILSWNSPAEVYCVDGDRIVRN
jgi:hypothetical protein